MATAAEVIEASRDYHPAFDERRVPEASALRVLSRLQRRLAAKVTALSEDALAAPFAFLAADVSAAALAGFAGAGLALPDHLLLLGFFTSRLAGPVSTVPVSLVSYANYPVEAARYWPSCFVLRGRLYPANRMELGFGGSLHGWEAFNGLSALLVLNPPELTARADEITLPDIAQDALVTGLAWWMAGRAGVAREVVWLQQDATDAEQTVVTALADQESTSTWTVVRTR